VNELIDFGRNAPYIVSAYGASFIALTALILIRGRKLKRALDAERAQDENKEK